MISTWIGKSVGFEPECSKEKSVTNSHVQTEILYNDEGYCQAPDRQNAQVQTEMIEKKKDIFVEYDANSLSCFLMKVTPFMCSVLEKNNKSQAFNRYEFLSDFDTAEISCLHVLDGPQTIEFTCPCVSWNSVGTAIAAAYSSNDHESWCEHDGSVGIWSLSRKDFDPKKPNIALETDCCITCVAFHPEQPAVLVAGKFNGEIVLWNISKEDDMLLGSSETVLGNHREPITGLHWLSNTNVHGVLEFVSCSLDGKILMWRLENNILTPHNGFIVQTEQLPRSFSIKSSKENAEVGIISLSINYEDQSIFVIGIEGGGIFQGSFNSLAPATCSGNSFIPLKDPITMAFDRHRGQVTSVGFSPFSRNVFISTGSDGELRIYSLLQPKPLKVLQLISGGINVAQWSPVRPLVIICISNDGFLYVWDLAVDEISPTESCLLDSAQAGGMSLQQNKESNNLLATSTTNGQIQIWQLPEGILKPGADEKRKLQEFSKNID